MDGVLVHEGQLIPGADSFLGALRRRGHPFLVLTNNSIYSARDLSARQMCIRDRALAALSRESTGPSYSSTTTSSPPPRAELWSWQGGTRARSAQTVP